MLKINVLIAADDNQMVKSLKSSLEKLDYITYGVTNNTTEAIKMAAKLKPDILLIDTKLNEYEDGIEAARKIIRKIQIPHVYISGDSDVDTIERSKSTRPYGYLLKPINSRDLNACLRLALFRFESEKKLKESEDRYFRLAENARDMIFRMSISNGEFDYVNMASIDITGYSPEEFYNTPNLLQNITHPDSKEVYRNHETLISEDRAPHFFEFKIINKSGEIRWLNQRNVVIKNDKKEPVLLEGIVTDVTEQKQYEIKLKDQREEYKLIFEAIPAMVMVKDASNKILRVNSDCAAYLGYVPSDLEGKYIRDIFPELFGKYYEEDRRVINSGEPLIGILEEFTDKLGERRILKYDKFPYYDSGNNITGVIVMVQDITKQVETENKLREVELKNSVLISTIPDMFFEFDEQCRHLDFRAAKPEDLYSQPGEFLGKKVTEVLPSEVSIEYENRIRKAILRNEMQYYEYKLPIRNTERHFEARIFKSGYNRAIAIIRDITEEKSIETVLKESEDKFRRLYQNAPVAVSRLKLQNNEYDFVNREFERLSGYTIDEYNKLSQQEKSELIYEEDREYAKEQFRIWENEGYPGVKKLEYRIKNKNGKILWIQTYLYIDENIRGGKDFLVEFAIDVTERKLTDERIRENEERYRTFITQSPEGIFRLEFDKPVPTDIESDKQLNLIENTAYLAESNEQFAKMYGLSSSSEVIGRWGGNNSKIKENKPVWIWKKFIQNGYNLFEEEIEEKDKDGNTRFFLLNATGVVENNRLKNIWCLQWDITARKTAEDALKQSLNEKEILLKEIHHRVKNNLQIISSLLKLQAKYVTDEKALDLLVESQNRVQSMSLIHQKLFQTKDFSYIDFNEYLHTLTMHLQHSFGILADRVEINIDSKDIIMSIDNAIPSGLIINELVSNAFKYAFPGGRKGDINIHVVFDKATGDYWLTVRDNGIGFSKEFDITKSNTYGLNLVKLLVNQMGGTINIYSSGGTEFRINFRNTEYQGRS